MSEFKQLVTLWSQGVISRREFLRRTAVIGVAATAPGALYRGSALAAKKGGEFVVGLGHGSTTDSLDPGTYENDFMIGSSFARFNFLTEISNTGELVGELAQEWHASADAKTWTFKLRKGIEFHNGKTMGAEDVIASINHHRGQASSSAAKPIVDPIAEIKADGADIVIRLKNGNADFPYLMSDYHLPIMQATEQGVDWQSGIGTGPYAMQSNEPGVQSTFKRHANYFKSDRAHFDELRMLTIADVTARTNALSTGEIHMMDRVDVKTMHLLARNPSVKVEETRGNGHYSIPMRTHLKPFDDNRIRLALKYALDREAMLQMILRGHGYIGNDHPIGKANRYHAAELPQRGYDPDKSKFYLKQAGVSKLSVDLSAADAAFAGAVDAAVLFKEHAVKAGITINVVREPNDGYWSNVWNTDNRGWCMCYWGGRPTEDWMFSTAYAEGSEWNDSSWKYAKFNKLLIAARSELDEAKRREMYVEMQQLVSDEGGVIVPVFNNYVHAIGAKVAHDDQMAANWANDGHKYAERWWFA